eukprot:9018411-Pyramimonas_sp.AAC.1
MPVGRRRLQPDPLDVSALLVLPRSTGHASKTAIGDARLAHALDDRATNKAAARCKIDAEACA